MHSTAAKVVQMERKTKINHIYFYFRGAAYLIKGSALPQKHIIKRPKNYK